MKFFLLILSILFFLNLHARNTDSAKVIGVHPAVGKLISLDEKIKYKLFTEYKDSVFVSAQVLKLNDSTFQLSVRSIQGIEIKNHISTKQLDDLFYRIDDVEKGKKIKEEEYVMTDEEKKEERRKRSREVSASFWYNFLAQMTILTVETLLTIAFAY
jgi:hypothetical protein